MGTQCMRKPVGALAIGHSYATRDGKLAVIKSVNPFIADILHADGNFYRKTFYTSEGKALGTDPVFDLVAEVAANTVNAVEWLAAHSQTINGVTPNGVCVLDTGGEGYNLWLPAKRSALRDFMNY